MDLGSFGVSELFGKLRLPVLIVHHPSRWSLPACASPPSPPCSPCWPPCSATQVGGVVYVATGREHPALLCTTALLRTPHWLSAAHARQLAQQGSLRCEFKARYGQQPRPCTLYPVSQEAAASMAAAAAAAAAGTGGAPVGAAVAEAATAADAAGQAEAEAAAQRLGFRRSAYCRLQPEDSRVLPTYLVACFDEPAAAITPQQAFVLYDGEQCLGAALIALPGASLHEQAGTGTGEPPAAAAQGAG